MIEIKQIATVEELYRHRKADTGEVFVDAIMYQLTNGAHSNSAQEMADRLGMELRALSKVTEKLVGVKLKEMIMQWRMLQALDLLDNPDYSYEQVAHLCGFSSTQDLAAEFKRRHKTTIEAYRKGQPRRNSNYSLNQTAEKRKAVVENAQKLHKR